MKRILDIIYVERILPQYVKIVINGLYNALLVMVDQYKTGGSNRRRENPPKIFTQS